MADSNTTLGTQRTRTRRYDAPSFSSTAPDTEAPDPSKLIQSSEPIAPQSNSGSTSATTSKDPLAGLSGLDYVKAYLLKLNWTASDIARILVGPGQSSLTAEALYRQYAANSQSDQAVLLDLLNKAGAKNITVDPGLLSGLNKRDLQPSTTADIGSLVSEFSQLPDVQKMRFISLLSISQSPNTKAQTPNAGSPFTNPDVKYAPPSPSNNALQADKGAKTAARPPAPQTTPAPDKSTDLLPTVLKGSFDTLQTVLKGLMGGSTADKSSSTTKKAPAKNNGTTQDSGGQDKESSDAGSGSSAKPSSSKGKQTKDSSDAGSDDSSPDKAQSSQSKNKPDKDSTSQTAGDQESDDSGSSMSDDSTIDKLIDDDFAGTTSTNDDGDAFGPPNLLQDGEAYGPPSPADFTADVSEPD